MSDCGALSDRMPAVALGRSAWTAEEAMHLGRCRGCQDEWALIQLGCRLGKDFRADRDPQVATRAVLDRLAQARLDAHSRKRTWGFVAMASAAAVAAMVLTGPPAPTPGAAPRAPELASLRIQLPELDNLIPAELNAVLQTMDEPYVGGSADDTVAGDPDDEELDSGLDTWEG